MKILAFAASLREESHHVKLLDLLEADAVSSALARHP